MINAPATWRYISVQVSTSTTRFHKLIRSGKHHTLHSRMLNICIRTRVVFIEWVSCVKLFVYLCCIIAFYWLQPQWTTNGSNRTRGTSMSSCWNRYMIASIHSLPTSKGRTFRRLDRDNCRLADADETTKRTQGEIIGWSIRDHIERHMHAVRGGFHLISSVDGCGEVWLTPRVAARRWL